MAEKPPMPGRRYEPAGEIRREKRPHVVFCPNCDHAVGESVLKPGTLNHYRCRRCGEWTWLMVVAEPTTVDTAA